MRKIGKIKVWSDNYGHMVNIMIPKNWSVLNEAQNMIHFKIEAGDAKKLIKMINHCIYTEEE